MSISADLLVNIVIGVLSVAISLLTVIAALVPYLRSRQTTRKFTSKNTLAMIETNS